jgi:hypothetical protein
MLRGGGAVSPGDHQNPNPSPPCPFSFVAAQSAGDIPLMSAALARSEALLIIK